MEGSASPLLASVVILLLQTLHSKTVIYLPVKKSNRRMGFFFKETFFRNEILIKQKDAYLLWYLMYY